MPEAVVDPKQDSWVHAVLGLDTAGYGPAAGKGGPVADAGADAGAAAGGAGPGDATMVAAAAGAVAASGPTEMDTAMLPKWQQAVADKKWGEAAEILDGFSASVRKSAVAKLTAAEKKQVHTAAIKDVGESSEAALATAALEHPILGGAQAARSVQAEKDLPPKDKKAYDDLVTAAKSPAEKSYLGKGLAAGHTVAELTKFAKKIAGKDAKWLQDNLALTGDSKGKGVKQQWSMSCNATAAEAVKGEMDPLYALKMHEDNPKLTEADDKSGTKLNKKMAEEQRAWLEKKNPDGSKGGDAKARGDRSEASGRWNTDLLNDQSGSTGLEYKRELLDDEKKKKKGIEDMNAALDKKMPVPIVVGDGGPKTTYAHYVVITASDPGPPRYYSIHDPATGDTSIRSEEQLKGGNLGVSWNKISAIELPTAVPIKGKKVK